MLPGVLVPTILSYYALKQTENLIKITKSAIKFMGLTIALPISLICRFTPNCPLSGSGPNMRTLRLSWFSSLRFGINMSIMPLFSVNIASNGVFPDS